MFPPEPSENPEVWLGGLWASLQRAGIHFGGEAHLAVNDDGSISLRSEMKEVIPKEMRATVASYMKKYAKACGWKLSVSFRKRHCEVSVSALSKAASKASKN